MTKRMPHKPADLVPLPDAIHAMRIASEHMQQWIREGKVKLVDSVDGQAITRDEFRRIAHSDDALQAALEGIAHETARRQRDETSGMANEFEAEIAQAIEEYRTHIDTLERLHSKYHSRFDLLRDQTPAAAAYIILSRAIALLQMSFLCLENHYWESTVLLRPIDEALSLAEYFIVARETPQGKRHLLEWFRENRSPSFATCREAIERFSRSLGPALDDEVLGRAMKQLYKAKSKPIHGAFNNVFEVYRSELRDNILQGVGFDYGPCSYPRKILALVYLFRSSVWSAIQSFAICFMISDMKLDAEDVATVDALNRLFMTDINKGRELL